MYRVLFIDAYDSFSNNIIALLQETLPVSVVQIKIDDSRFVLNDDAFYTFLQTFDAVVAGPGPGNPLNPQDIGLIDALWRIPDHQLIPVLGICLGFQSLAHALGATICRLDEPRHGRVAPIEHCNADIFSGAGACVVTQYHSLYAQLSLPHNDSSLHGLFHGSSQCPDLNPLAWDITGANAVLMGIAHRTKPFWGVQFHPESICTNSCGEHVVREWFHLALTWAEHHRDSPSQPVSSSASSISELLTPPDEEPSQGKHSYLPEFVALSTNAVTWRRVHLAHECSTLDVLEWARQCAEVEPILLESGCRGGKPVNPETGRYSVIGLRDPTCFEVRYHNRTLSTLQHGRAENQSDVDVGLAFDTLGAVITQHKATSGPARVPFWGGLVGYVSYEAGLETISVPVTGETSLTPDIWFVLVDRSLVIDHIEGLVYIQSIRANDDVWIDGAVKDMQNLRRAPSRALSTAPAHLLSEPTQDEYCKKVELCQEYLRSGDSYELCLTDETLINNKTEPLLLYRTLRDTNPAPFAAYLRFGSGNVGPAIDFVGTSPERFLSWSRCDKTMSSTCQYRPIKGTVKKTDTMTRAKAEEILKSEKEQAENLMIVDLIRHDLNGVPGVGPVRVPKLMSVEEYETVYQLVSVIEGDVASPHGGLEALARSLPPGSMTGAPKKRSCELLSLIEGRARSLYSGVLGYLDVGGGGDFSVVIRSAFREGDGNPWRIGAGGAITALSTADAEWEEMLAKRERLLSVFL